MDDWLHGKNCMDGFRVESPKKFQVSLDNLRSDIFLYPHSMAERGTPEAEQLEF